MKASRFGAFLLLAVMLVSFVATSGLVLAVHDHAFQLDGDISPIDQNPGGPGTPTVDWQDLFDVVGNDVPSPKASLPADFITAFFARDFVPGESGPDRTTFATGSKDTLNITPGWQCARDNNVNDKTDLVNVYANAYIDPGTGELNLYFALERYSNEGAGNVAFWFLQDGTVDCLAPASGPSTTDFTGDHRDGDILVVSEFTVGGTVTTINAYRWMGDAGGFLDTTPIASGADCKTEGAGDDICATVNTSLFTPPWLTETKQPGNTPSNDLDVSEFFEGGISLTDLGLADRCFARVLADTRSSPSLTATIFDFALGDLSVCDLQVTKSGDTLSKVGDDVDYTITIENTGGVTLYKQSIVDSLFGDLTDGSNALITSSDCGASLAAGDSCTITVTRTVQEGDPDPLPNTVTVVYNSSSDLLGDEVTREDDHSVNLFQPSIAFDKSVSSNLSKVGDSVDYTLVLSNTSSADAPALDCTITDAALEINKSVTLASGEADTTMQSYTFQEGDSDPYDNTASVSCSPQGFPNVLPASDSESVNLFQPSIGAAKTGDTLSKVGDDVDYTITLSNTSSADTPALTCTATDSLLGEVFSGVLPSGATVLNLSRTVQAGDPDPLVNTVTLDCKVADPFGNMLSAEASHSTNLFQPSIAFDKSVSSNLSKVGDSVDYTLVLSNTSSADAPALDCTITDAALEINKSVTLASGEADTTMQSYTFQEGDSDPYDNTASVSCSPQGFPNVLPASDSESVNLFQPSIAFDKTGSQYSKAGDDVSYTLTLSNTSSGDTPDLVCTITDAMLEINKSVTLASGASDVTNATYTVQAGDPDPLENTASVSCSPIDFPNVLNDSDGHSVDLIHPSFTVAKSCVAEPISYLGPANFQVTIANTGDVPLDITADDGIGAFQLAAGASQDFDVSVPGPFTPGGTADNTVTASWTLPELYGLDNTDTKSASDSCDVLQPVYETAYALGDAATCFIDLGVNNWGWVNGDGMNYILPGDYIWPVWAGAAQCDTNNGTLVGTATVSYDGTDVSVTFDLDPQYVLGDTHIYAGYDQIPPGGFAPGQWQVYSPFDGSAIYIIVHAVVGIPQ